MIALGSAARQAMLWSADPNAWAQLQEPSGKPLWIAMMKAANVGWRTRLLDVGCAAGGAAGVARGLGAKVAGIDACEALVRLGQLRVRHADLRVGEMQALPFRDGEFNLVTAANTLEYAGDPAHAVREMVRVSAPGGLLAIGGYATGAGCDQAQVFEAIRRCLPFAPPSGPLTPFDETRLSELLAQAGACVTGVEIAHGTAEYPDIETAWHAQRAAGWTQGVLQIADEDDVRCAVIRALRPFLQPDGSVRLNNEYRIVTALRMH